MQQPKLGPERTELIEVTPGIYLRVHGWADDRPFALIPGWPLPEDIFDHQMSQLAQTGFRAVSVPLHSFHRSDRPVETYDYYLFIDDIVDIANHLDLSAVRLCGRNLGGAIAIHYTSIRCGYLASRLALFGAPTPACDRRLRRLGGLELFSNHTAVQALNGQCPAAASDEVELFDRQETLINAGVSTWFLCQGWSEQATTDNASEPACFA